MHPITQTFIYYSDIESGPVKATEADRIEVWQKTAVRMGVPLYLSVSNVLLDTEWPNTTYETHPVYTPALQYFTNLIDIEYPVKLYFTSEEELKSPLLIKYEDYLTHKNNLLDKKTGILISATFEDKPDVLYLRHFNYRNRKKVLNWLVL